jgi:hypothetical protein
MSKLLRVITKADAKITTFYNTANPLFTKKQPFSTKRIIWTDFADGGSV